MHVPPLGRASNGVWIPSSTRPPQAHSASSFANHCRPPHPARSSRLSPTTPTCRGWWWSRRSCSRSLCPLATCARSSGGCCGSERLGQVAVADRRAGRLQTAVGTTHVALQLQAALLPPRCRVATASVRLSLSHLQCLPAIPYAQQPPLCRPCFTLLPAACPAS